MPIGKAIKESTGPRPCLGRSKWPHSIACSCLLLAAVSFAFPAEMALAQNQTQPVSKKPVGLPGARSLSGILAPIPLDSSATPPIAPNIQRSNAAKSGSPGNGPAPISLKSKMTESSSSRSPGIDCRVPVQAIGPVVFPNNVVVINSRTIEVRNASDTSGLMPAALRGVVIRLDTPEATTNGAREMTGLAYFTSGNLILELGNKSGEDMIFRNEGTVFGDIVRLDSTSILVRQKDGQNVTVPLTAVNYLRSPRAFLFTLVGRPGKNATNLDSTRTQVEAVSFQPTFTENVSESTPTSVIPERKVDEFGLDDDEGPGFTITSSQSRYQPAIGSPVFDNNRPPVLGLPRRGIPAPNWP